MSAPAGATVNRFRLEKLIALVTRTDSNELAACSLACLIQLAVCGLAIAKSAGLPLFTDAQLVWAFGVSVFVALFAAWLRAVHEERLPTPLVGKSHHNHIGGIGFLALAAAIGTIAGLAYWAAPGSEQGRSIQVSFGVGVVCLVAAVYLVLIVGPHIASKATALVRVFDIFRSIVAPLGKLLSSLDGFLVFAVAGAAGAARRTDTTRYLILLCNLACAGLLGFLLEPPFGILPIVWAFALTLALSRRWAWIEEDMSLSVLNRNYTGKHVRVGFGQDLRDEALTAFLSLVFLVPLALRQVQLASELYDAPIFAVTHAQADNFMNWLGFFGTELAKAVPFVDWAEVYQVHGLSAISVESESARHVVFATRIFVDLALLAALLQGLSVSARISKQKELFFKEHAIDRLDPFIEAIELRKLVRRNGTSFEVTELSVGFPKYDQVRLLQLSQDDHHPEVAFVARHLLQRDGYRSAGDLHDDLLQRALQIVPREDAIREVITAIRARGRERDFDTLVEARSALNGKGYLVDERKELVRLMVEGDRSDERTAALATTLRTEARAEVRALTLGPLQVEAADGNTIALEALRRAASTDSASWVLAEARGIVDQLVLPNLRPHEA